MIGLLIRLPKEEVDRMLLFPSSWVPPGVPLPNADVGDKQR